MSQSSKELIYYINVCGSAEFHRIYHPFKVAENKWLHGILQINLAPHRTRLLLKYHDTQVECSFVIPANGRFQCIICSTLMKL
jgi:hypothetical protein